MIGKPTRLAGSQKHGKKEHQGKKMVLTMIHTGIRWKKGAFQHRICFFNAEI